MTGTIKILAIDDSEDILFAISALCEFQGWLPFLAKDGFQGLELFKNHKPHLVLMDFHLPKMDGIQTVKLIRQLHKAVPIVVLTVDESQAVLEKFMEAGADDYAVKPIRAPDLISRIKVHLKMRGPLSEEETGDRNYIKGITKETMVIITDILMRSQGFTTISDISRETGLAYQTVHRYVQHLQEQKRLEINLDYGKQGRPTQKYRLR